MRERKLITWLGWAMLVGFLFPLALSAQDPAPSVADAARRSREGKKKTAKPARVVTDDSRQGSSSTSATSSQENAKSPQAHLDSTGTEDSKPAEDADVDLQKKKKAEIEALRQRIKEQKESVKLAEREIALRQDTFYSNPDYAHDKAGKDKLDALKADLQQKQDTLADLRAKLAALGGSEDAVPDPAQK